MLWLFPLLACLLERVEDGKGRCPDEVRYTVLFSLSGGWPRVSAAQEASGRKHRTLQFGRHTPTPGTLPCSRDDFYALVRLVGAFRTRGPAERVIIPGTRYPIFVGTAYP